MGRAWCPGYWADQELSRRDATEMGSPFPAAPVRPGWKIVRRGGQDVEPVTGRERPDEVVGQVGIDVVAADEDPVEIGAGHQLQLQLEIGAPWGAGPALPPSRHRQRACALWIQAARPELGDEPGVELGAGDQGAEHLALIGLAEEPPEAAQVARRVGDPVPGVGRGEVFAAVLQERVEQLRPRASATIGRPSVSRLRRVGRSALRRELAVPRAGPGGQTGRRRPCLDHTGRPGRLRRRVGFPLIGLWR